MALTETLIAATAKGAAGALAKLSVDHAARSFSGKNAEKIRTDIGPHIEATFQRCTSLKTLLNPHHPADFLSVYSTQRFDVGGNKHDQYGLVDFIKFECNHVIVTGTGGTGKSMFMKYLWLSLFVDSDGRVPIFVELRSTNSISHSDIVQYIYHSLSAGKAKISQKDFNRRLSSGDFAIILDGFDELNADRKDRIATDLINLSHEYPDLKIVISSRPDESRFSSWPNFHVASVDPLQKPDLIELIQKAEFDPTSKSKFLKKIKDGSLYDSHKSFLSNPLLASMMLLTFSHNFDIPDTTHLFYEQAFDALFQRHDSHKTYNYKREFATPLSEFEFKRLLSYLCLVTYFDNKFEFSRDDLLQYIEKARKFEKKPINAEDFLHDLEHCVCMMVPDGLVYGFPHRSFQEYFAAYCLAYVTQNRFSDIVSEIGKRHADQTVKLISDMNPEAFRENFLIPKAEELAQVLQLGARRKSVEKYMIDTGLAFRYHLYGESEDFIISLLKSSPAQDYMFLLEKIFPSKRRTDSPNDDRILYEAFKKSVNGRRLGAIDVMATSEGMVFRAIPADGRPFTVRKNSESLVAAFQRSVMHIWLQSMLVHTDQIIASQRASRTTTSDAMADLFRE